MAGLNLKVMGGVQAAGGNGFSSSSSPSTAVEAGFGQAYSAAGTPSTTAALTPNDPFGIAFWVGVGSLALLLLVRHSLPA